MVKVELIYDSDCPNVEQARAQLLKAFVEVGLEARWQEWLRSDAKSPDYVRKYGSPTILVEGRDLAGFLPEGTVRGCRIYFDTNGKPSGVPSVEAITSALLKAKEKASHRRGKAASRTRRYRRVLSVFPTIGAVLIPGISCPACWPAYAALLSSIGVGFVNYTPYLFLLTLLCLAVALISLGFRARRRRSFGPFALGSAAALVIVISKFVLDWKAATFAGLILLVAASIWNLWPRKKAGGACCTNFVSAAEPRT